MFHFRIRILITNDIRETCKKLYKKEPRFTPAEKGEEEREVDAKFISSSAVPGDYYIVVSWKGLGISLLAHEFVHAVIRIMLDRGLAFSEDNQEVLAYMVEWLLFRAMQKIVPLGKGKMKT